MKKYETRKGAPEKIRKELAAYPEFLQDLLYSRGIEKGKDAEAFLNPDYELQSHDPFLMKDMDRAVKRILKAIDRDEKIAIYSDYDSDGIPGGVLLYDFFNKVGFENFVNYIPHRHEEGYGVNISAVEALAQGDTKVIITVDCGITDVLPVERANKLGIDVIITDHHLIGAKLPPAYAIINNKQEDDTYPFDQLCGAGTAFKLVQALLQKGDFNIREGWEKWLLDMAGLSTIADMVPLIGENRVFAYYGLAVLRKSRRPGLQQLCRKMKIQQKHITEDDIGFMISPRINAASRMDHPMDAFRMLATDDITEADTLSSYLNKINDERKGVVASMVKEVKRRLRDMSEIRDVIVMGDPRWRPALVGLAANSIVEEYNRPVFIWGREGGDTIKGSCRSDGSVNLVEMMHYTEEIFIDAGGHKFSGGFSVIHENVHLLEDKLLDAYKNVATEAVDEKVLVDREMTIDDVSWDTYRVLEKLAPFGEGNPKPIFLFKKAKIAGKKHFGKDKNHLELSFENTNGKKVPAIGFFMTDESFGHDLDEGDTINLVATMEKSTFRSFPELRLRIVDII